MLAAPARLRELVAYQDGGVVSRQLFKSEAGNLTLFAFDAGQSLTEHTSPFEAMVLVLEGEAEIQISGRSHRLREGEILRMPAGQPHAVKARQRFKMLLVMLRPAGR